ncbi:flavoprotein [Oscillatoria amoena NRMC-F 0135]|nr:flavoprotein [Oscillatoria laete-virens]MDL5045791.1 flavoprotein [Oscillatoria amoena NRMC-F 0135]MDL5055163.1 flavoprotein [Oscillatoria laete-virens NRMC-F 0139]
MKKTSKPQKKRAPVVVLGVTGSIAAYKAPDIAGKLRKAGCEVHCVMTRDAGHFITPLSLQTISRHPVLTDLFAETAWEPGHIALADEADLILVAPATANALAKFAHGLADDALSCTVLASEARKLIAPAMNGKMWLNPATQDNVALLKKRGFSFIGPETGMLACGYEGIGRLWETDGIVEKALSLLK